MGQIEVVAQGEINGRMYFGVNQKARAQIETRPPLIPESHLKNRAVDNNNSFPANHINNLHAEIDAIHQAYAEGVTRNADMTIAVRGKTVCNYCLSDLSVAAKNAGLKSLTVLEEDTGVSFIWKWDNGKRTFIKRNEFGEEVKRK